MKIENTILTPRPFGTGVADTSTIQYRHPRLEDGAAVWKLVEESRVLDSNSTYLYLLLCHHFSDTCFIGEDDGNIVAFLSAYKPPNNPETIFVWQITVHNDMRRRGVASTMLNLLVDEIMPSGTVAYVEATITPANMASGNLFRSLAAKHRVECLEEVLFTRDSFGDQSHQDEVLFRLGPFNRDYKSEVSAVT